MKPILSTFAAIMLPVLSCEAVASTWMRADAILRPSTPAESRFFHGDQSDFGPVDCAGVDNPFLADGTQCVGQWQTGDHIWQAGISDVGQSTFTANEEITIIVPSIVQNRFLPSVAFSIDGNSLLIESQEYAGIQSMEIRWPEDIRKELVLPVGALRPGTYELTIRRNLNDPGYSDLWPAHTDVIEDVVTFTVVPEPSAIWVVGMLGLCALGGLRRR